MKDKKISKKIMLLLLSLFMLMVHLPTVAESSGFKRVERVTITVALPRVDGINGDLDNSYLTGYTHEYLTKISQISPINFEFIFYNTTNSEITEAMEGVQRGEIDIMGETLKMGQLQESYLYSHLAYGYVNTSLLALASNDAINERILLNQEPFTIGINKNAIAQVGLVTSYCENQNLTPTVYYYDTYQETIEALRKGEVDAIAGRDTSRDSDFKVVLQIESKPYYFISATNKTSVMTLLNEAMIELSLIDATYTERLYKKYYSTEDFSVSLTRDEQNFIKELRTLKVGVVPDKQPLQYYEVSTNHFKGILVDLMNQVSSETGLKIEYVNISNMDNLKEQFEYGVIDLILGVAEDYQEAEQQGYLISSALVSLPVVHLSNRSNKGFKRTAMAGYLSLSDDYLKVSDDSTIFKMLASGEFSEAYIDGYRAQYFASSYGNIDITPSSYDNYDLSVGLYNKGDYRIMNILEQGIQSISNREAYDIIYNNVIDKSELTFFDYVKRNPLQGLLILAVLSIFAIGILILFLYKTTHMKKAMAEEREKYEILSQHDQLTNVLNQQTFKKKVQSHIVVGDSGTLVAIDLDNFKEINDSYGHFEGDKVLEKFANSLMIVFKEHIIGRLGGDEFMIYLDDVHNTSKVESYFEELLREIERMNLGFEFTISAGATVFRNQDDFDKLYRHVDNLLYDVKNEGRNGIKVEKYK